ncbi:hypothetical protein ACXDF8_25695 [Mycolicibacterium sp. CBM1]
MKAKEATKPDRRLSARCAAVASLGAAVIHFAVAPMHWRDWLVSGVFFAGVAVFQLLWALLVWSRPGTGVLAAGFVANAGAAALWVVSRTVGVPFGPHGGQPEAVDGAGIAVLLLQCYVVMGAGWALLTRYRAEDVGGFGRALVLVGANAVMVGAVAVGLASGLQGHHHGDVAEAEGEHSAAHEAHAEGHHHDADHTDSVAPPKPAVPNPATSPVPADSGRPVTDMGLHTDDGHHDHS